MGVDYAPAVPSALDFKSWLPFATFTDSEKLAEAALAAKTVVAEARLKEATDATRLAAEVLRSSRQEVLGLKVVVQTLKSASGASGGGASPRAARELEEERSKLREAQLHADGLKRSFDALLADMERLRSDASAAAAGEAGAPRAPELLRPASAAGEPSRAVAVARCVLMGYSAAQAEGALAELGRNDAAAAVALLKSLGANAEADPPTAARLGAASRTYSPYPVGPVTFPKGRPPAAAGAAAWPGAARARAGVRGDLFRARRRAADMLVALTGRGFAEALGDSEAARGFCLRALGGAKMLATRPVPARLLLRAGGLEAASAVMAVYRRDGPIVCAAAAVLRELAANEFSAAAVASSPKLPAALLAAVAALKSNPGHIAVGVHCAALLWSLCSLGGRRAQSLALDASAPPLLYKLLTEHAEQRELVWRATGALLAMALHNAETQAALSRQGAQIYVREALARDPTLQYGGEFSELRLWMRAQVVLPPPPAAEEPDLAEPGAVGRDSNPRGRPAAWRRAAAAAAAARASGGGGWAPSASLAEAWEEEAEAEEEEAEAEAEGDGYYAVATRAGGYVQPLSRRALAGTERVAAAAAAAAAASRAGSVAGSLRGSGRNTPLRGAEEEALLASAPERYAYAAAAAAGGGGGGGALPRPLPGYMWEVDELGAAEGPGSLAQLLPSAYAPLSTTQPLPLSPYPARPFTSAEGELVDPSYERERAATKAASRARSQASTPARRASPAPGGEEAPADSLATARAAQLEAAAEAAASAAAAAEAEALAEQLEYRAADEAVRSELQGQVSAVSRRAAEAEARARAAEARAVAAEARAAELEACAAAEARAAAAEERAAVAEALAAELRRQRAAAAAEAAAEAAARRSAGARAAAAAAEAEAEASAAQEEAEAAERRSAAAVAACAAAKARLEQRSHDVSLAEVQRSVAAQAAREAALGARGDDDSPLPAAAPSPSADDSRPTTPEAAALQTALALLLAPAPPPAQALSSALRSAARAVASPAAARSLLSAGGVPALVRCLAARGAAEPALAADACLLLGVLTQETEVGPACRAEDGPCADGSAARALVSVLRSHPATVALQATAAWALWGLLRLDEEDGGGAEAQAAAAAEAGAAGALADALRAHPASPEVAQSAAGGLLALAAAGGEAGKASVSAVGGVALVRQAAQRHPSLTFRGEFDGLRGWLKSEAKKAAKRS